MIQDNFSIVRGDTWTETWTLTDDDGLPANVAGAKFWMTLKNGYTDADPGVLQLSSPSSGITIVDAANGVVKLRISAAQSAALAALTYFYDIQMKTTDAEGDVVTTLAKGRVTFESDVTNTTA